MPVTSCIDGNENPWLPDVCIGGGIDFSFPDIRRDSAGETRPELEGRPGYGGGWSYVEALKTLVDMMLADAYGRSVKFLFIFLGFSFRIDASPLG